ncbi:hypothetical protein EVS84_09995 [Pseudomonas koreensis]|uniref:Uncharacterized protein n=2 Tax=Pseudomonas TaxID=286 RepID=A0AAQ2I261_9PSED|nr:hypothetical protein DMX04_16775 [Pseudomonas koreensis]RRW57278.1 hypothetical protein EGJ55_06995 [Pseudomonas moraviensis]RRW65458.1 hypothetical protein EGJ53_11880 [Pseudomonas fluorescens]RYM42766.1 hypothetical protein EVS84_09995 [Pseudomonas koreensis]THF34042.1 hypothetical protein E5170_07075 [Pseudomonas atacamensis]
MGASLLAKTEHQSTSMLAGVPHSRAGSLPHLFMACLYWLVWTCLPATAGRSIRQASHLSCFCLPPACL